MLRCPTLRGFDAVFDPANFALANTRKPLAGWATDNYVNAGQAQLHQQITRVGKRANVAGNPFREKIVAVGHQGQHNIKTRSFALPPTAGD